MVECTVIEANPNSNHNAIHWFLLPSSVAKNAIEMAVANRPGTAILRDPKRSISQPKNGERKTDKPAPITIPDESRVRLQPNSSCKGPIKIPSAGLMADINEKRMVAARTSVQ